MLASREAQVHHGQDECGRRRMNAKLPLYLGRPPVSPGNKNTLMGLSQISHMELHPLANSYCPSHLSLIPPIAKTRDPPPTDAPARLGYDLNCCVQINRATQFASTLESTRRLSPSEIGRRRTERCHKPWDDWFQA